jgi:CAAX prenyl protease-like protein
MQDSLLAGSSAVSGLNTRHAWLVFVFPFAVYMLANSFEPQRPAPAADVAVAESGAAEPAAPQSGWLPEIPYRYYPAVYTVKIALTLLAMAMVWPGYKAFPFRVSPLALVLGAVGTAMWIGLCKLGLEQKLVSAIPALASVIGLGERSGFNPLAEMADRPALAYGFLAVRFLGLAAVVPVIEEFFLRGFVQRFVTKPEWQQVRIGEWHLTAVLLTTGLAALMHPAELVAEVVWFSMVTWLVTRTRNIWDAVGAHGVTNLCLGLYVLATGEWQFM